MNEGILRSTQRARARIFGVPGALEAERSARPQVAFTFLLAAQIDREGLAVAALRRRLSRWVEAAGVARVTDGLRGALMRAEGPESVRRSLLRTAENDWCMSRRFNQQVAECIFGCGAGAVDTVEHYLF